MSESAPPGAGDGAPDFSRFSDYELGECWRYGETRELRYAAWAELDRRKKERMRLEEYAREVNARPSQRMRTVARRTAEQTRSAARRDARERRSWHDGRAAAAGDDRED